MKRSQGLGPTVPRELLHTRRIEINGYKREDGLYDVEGHLVDTKPNSVANQSRDRLRQAFTASPEFSARVNAIVAQGCLR